MSRISGRDLEVRLRSGLLIPIEQINVNTDDGIAAASDQGYPNGWVRGRVTGDGDMEIATETMLLINAEAAEYGSWEDMPAFDMSCYAKVGDLELDVGLFGVKLKFPGLQGAGEGGEKLMHTVPFIVTGRDFITINGVSLARRR